MAMRVEIGAGASPDLYYDIHVDIRPLDHIEVVGAWEDSSVQFPPESVDEIKASQVLEHLSRPAQVGALQKSLAWLKPGGYLNLWTPDLKFFVEWISNGYDVHGHPFSWSKFQHFVFGAQNYIDNQHRFLHCEETLRALLVAIGYAIISFDRDNGSLVVVAQRPK